MRCGFLAFTFLLAPFCVFSSENSSIDLEPIVVQKQDLEALIPGWYSYIEFRDLPLNSSEDILEYITTVDLRKRIGSGIHRVMSIRGSFFEDNRILLNGIEINDPQTGHFSLEIPFTGADLDRVELAKNSRTVNFVVKKPEDKGGFLEASFGEHAYFQNLLSVNFPLKNVKNRLSLQHKKSKGARRDTDFDVYNLTFHSLWEQENKELEFLYGFLGRDFGVDGVYAAPVYTQEEEHIDQRFFSLRYLMKEDHFNIQLNPFFRRHFDKFILDRHNPSFFTNYHTTYVYGLDTRTGFIDWGLFLDLGLRKEKITSTNIGNHKRLRKTVSLGLNPKRLGNFLLEGYIRRDYHSTWEWIESFDADVGYFLGDNLKLRFSFDKTYRAPSFTELFYSSPSNRGNPGLGTQKMNSFQWGIDYLGDNLKAGLGIFLRKQKDTIDWGRNSSAVPWQAGNIGDIKAKGFDIDFDFSLGDCSLREVSLAYTFLQLDSKNPYNYSKYLFNYLKHRFLVIPRICFNGYLEVSPVLIFEDPVNSRSRVVFNLNITCKVNDGLSFFLEGQNISNEVYQELEGVDADPRWWKIGFSCRF